jgi:gamma-glutamyltranspeptidase/glutathione hydrolase
MNAVITSPHYLATKVGTQVLLQGGNVFDASVAVALAVGVLQPYHSGLGGGGTALIRTAKGDFAVIQSRGTAHHQAGLRRPFHPTSNKELRGMIVPGLLAGLLKLHTRFGSLDWSILCEGALQLAKTGFPADSQFIRITLSHVIANPQDFPISLSKPIKMGAAVLQPKLACTLFRIIQDPLEFYRGSSAKMICDFVKEKTALDYIQDFSEYQPVESSPLAMTYRGWNLLFPGLPHIGAVQVMLALLILETFELNRIPCMSTQYYHLLAEAIKVSFIERANLHHKDDLPYLLSKEKVKECVAKIRADRAIPFDTLVTPSDLGGGTSHITIGDENGNIVALTQTIGRHYGCGWIEPESGVILNDLMGDFSSGEEQGNINGIWNGQYNIVKPGAIPASSQSPIIAISPRQEQVIAVGGAGGPKIVSAVLQALVNRIDYGYTITKCLKTPRIHTHGSTVLVEPGLSQEIISDLRSNGHPIKVANYLSQVQMISCQQSSLEGSADPRGVGSVDFIK